LYQSLDSSGAQVVAFSYKTNYAQVPAPAMTDDNAIWLKLVRVNHVLSGYCSSNGYTWFQIGNSINVADMENQQSNYNAWTGNRQGLFVQGKSADFDLYIYRDAYTPILAECPANQSGTTASVTRVDGIGTLDNIHDSDWALYAGVEFGNAGKYPKNSDSLAMIASCGSSGGAAEVWLDSIDTGTKIAVCSISNTGSWSDFKTFTTHVLSPVSGNHDVYLKFIGTGTDKLFQLRSFMFVDKDFPETSVRPQTPDQTPHAYFLGQNYPNPFNPTTNIGYQLPVRSDVSLKVFDILGRDVGTIVGGVQPAGAYTAQFDGSRLASGTYVYQMRAGAFVESKKFLLLK